MPAARHDSVSAAWNRSWAWGLLAEEQPVPVPAQTGPGLCCARAVRRGRYRFRSTASAGRSRRMEGPVAADAQPHVASHRDSRRQPSGAESKLAVGASDLPHDQLDPRVLRHLESFPGTRAFTCPAVASHRSRAGCKSVEKVHSVNRTVWMTDGLRGRERWHPASGSAQDSTLPRRVISAESIVPAWRASRLAALLIATFAQDARSSRLAIRALRGGNHYRFSGGGPLESDHACADQPGVRPGHGGLHRRLSGDRRHGGELSRGDRATHDLPGRRLRRRAGDESRSVDQPREEGAVRPPGRSHRGGRGAAPRVAADERCRHESRLRLRPVGRRGQDVVRHVGAGTRSGGAPPCLPPPLLHLHPRRRAYGAAAVSDQLSPRRRRARHGGVSVTPWSAGRGARSAARAGDGRRRRQDSPACLRLRPGAQRSAADHHRGPVHDRPRLSALCRRQGQGWRAHQPWCRGRHSGAGDHRPRRPGAHSRRQARVRPARGLVEGRRGRRAHDGAGRVVTPRRGQFLQRRARAADDDHVEQRRDPCAGAVGGGPPARRDGGAEDVGHVSG